MNAELTTFHTFELPCSDNVTGSLPYSASDGHRGHGSSTWGRVTAGYIVGQWECLRLGLRHEGSTYSLPDLTAWCQDALDVTSGRTIIPIVQCVKGFISKVKLYLNRTWDLSIPYKGDLTVNAIFSCHVSAFFIGNCILNFNTLYTGYTKLSLELVLKFVCRPLSYRLQSM